MAQIHVKTESDRIQRVVDTVRVSELKIQGSRSVLDPGRVAIVAREGARADGFRVQLVGSAMISASRSVAISPTYQTAEKLLLPRRQNIVKTRADAEIMTQIDVRSSGKLADKS